MTRVSRLKQYAFDNVEKILDRGGWSEAAMYDAIEYVVNYADQLYASLARFQGYRGFEDLVDDQASMAVRVQSAGIAEGEQTFASSEVRASLLSFDKVSIAIGSATSIAAAQGTGVSVEASTFRDMVGGDLAMVDVTTGTSRDGNAEVAIEKLFAVDFHFLRDFEQFRFDEKNAIVEAALDLDGNIATAQVEANVVGDGILDVSTDALAIEGALSAAFAGADLLLA